MSVKEAAAHAEEYLNTGSGATGIRVCVPAYERMMQLYAFGHTVAQISEILHQEFQDIDFNPLSFAAVKKIIELNQTEFQIARMNMGLKCRDEIQRQIATLFVATEGVETFMVSVYINKLNDALSQLADIDMEAKDEDGNYINTSRTFVLIELADKLQSKISKVVGTDALREIEIFRKKAQAKAEAENNKGGLLPARGREVGGEEDAPKFI